MKSKAPRALHSRLVPQRASFPEQPSSPFRDPPLSPRLSWRSLLLSPRPPFFRSKLSNPPSALLTFRTDRSCRGAVLGRRDVRQLPWSRPRSTSNCPNPERVPAPPEGKLSPSTTAARTTGALGRPPATPLQMRWPGPTLGQWPAPTLTRVRWPAPLPEGRAAWPRTHGPESPRHPSPGGARPDPVRHLHLAISPFAQIAFLPTPRGFLLGGLDCAPKR